jgi:hypothetical protein
MIVIWGCDKDEMNIKEPCIQEETHNFTDSIFHIGVPGDMEHGFANAQKLSKDWTASLIVYDWDTTLGMAFLTDPQLPSIRLAERMYIDGIPKDTGCYNLDKRRNAPLYASYHLSDFDVGVGEYVLYQEDQVVNKIELLRLTEDSVFGRFSMSFLDTGKIQWLEPDYIRFYNGKFEARLMK